ncbi:NusG domain II-containing protein [Lacrimispora sp. BS-2]|uniref:NusG domain II-containing protein n=1 Tax=Lacrimispora sp. BS-2 TaxID=3151850 RepID=A0AAU7PMU3_9FIRM
MKNLKKLTVIQKRELILVGAILVISGLLSGIFYARNRKPAEQVVVTVDGKPVVTLDLHKDTDMVIDGYGGTDHLVIKDGYASITEASCPDKVCVRTGKIHRSGELIVCLPNRVVVTIEGEE